MGANASSEVPEQTSTTEGTLDFNWWASDGPTGGYLISLAIEAATGRGQAPHTQGRSLDLHIVGGARADRYEASLGTARNGSGSPETEIVFRQHDTPFAVASLRGLLTMRKTLILRQSPPDALPPQRYKEMVWSEPAPPVTSQFSYRPVVSSDGTTAFSDRDLVWIRPTGRGAFQYGVTAVVDSWYPAHFMQSVRAFLRGDTSELHEPSATALEAVHATIFEPRRPLAPEEHVLLASRLIAASSGHYEEQFEIWSENGSSLLAGRIFRRDSPARSTPRASDDV